jgi:signal peptidase I, archaeal type
MNIAEKIKSARTAKGLTQKDLGTALCVSDKAVSKWERGVAMPDIATIPKLCEVLSIDTGELFGEEKQPKPFHSNPLPRKRKNLLPVLLPIMAVVLVIIIGAVSWNLLGINTYKVLTSSMSPAIKRGQTVVVMPAPVEQIKVGDIITYSPENNMTITHRVVEKVDGQEIWFITKGDNNPHPDERKANKKSLVGKVIFVF